MKKNGLKKMTEEDIYRHIDLQIDSYMFLSKTKLIDIDKDKIILKLYKDLTESIKLLMEIKMRKNKKI